MVMLVLAILEVQIVLIFLSSQFVLRLALPNHVLFSDIHVPIGYFHQLALGCDLCMAKLQGR